MTGFGRDEGAEGRVELRFDKPERPALAWTPPEHAQGFGEPRPTIGVGFTNVGAYEGDLWACDTCGAVVAKWPDDHPFQNRAGKDSFEVHASWHRAILKLELRR